MLLLQVKYPTAYSANNSFQSPLFLFQPIKLTLKLIDFMNDVRTSLVSFPIAS